ncbi:50S ribosomal protein L18 [Candidatus Nanohalococcus occultus]|uniref:50S ribosomal protein L18 n=1 Tax=Candidatus Nanohalococcus occultus TaxID=2978047 RepID=UPI0039E053B4
MADSSNYRVQKRRRRDQETDYQNRLSLLKSGKPRAVVRTSNQHTRVQVSEFEREGDRNTAQTVSKQLEEFGWDHSTGNLPAAYLTGFLAGMKADTDKAVLDTGLRSIKAGGRTFAAVQGLNDAGVHVPVGEQMVPEQGRLHGEHIEEMKDVEISDDVESVKESIEGELQ